ncbi:MAG TPA: tetratricopeptide repeat protein [Acidobacteriaceae bacterium]|jgi:tetratricopeptide (TPR) repeat protein|nr:tetratricopeptide repeat protein [Acidobacteriaceae bacterium]
MPTLQAGTILTPEERLARRRLILRDAISLVTLFLITAVIFALTLLLYRSFENHRQELGMRWKARGEAALNSGHPEQAIDALRSALAYVPSRDTEIELATALAAAGKTQEATIYFSTLLESAPGDGTINLQLARLYAKQGKEPLALQHYQLALDGTWAHNGFDRRRDVRLEMARYLLSRHEFDSARTQLLIAASNAPNDPNVKIEIAALLLQAHAPQDALGIYRSVAASRNPPIAALEGAGRTAFALGMYRVAADYLGRALAGPQAAALPDNQKMTDRDMLDTSLHILLLYPSLNLSPRNRAERILAIRKTARQRLTDCSGTPTAVPPTLAVIVARWSQLPTTITLDQLEQNPDLEQSILQLAYDTETATAKTCGAPTGDDALLFRIAGNPNAVEQE